MEDEQKRRESRPNHNNWRKNHDTNNKKRIDYMNVMTEELFRQCIRQRMGNS
ncbi:MAG: hypothetical protein ACJ71F_20795 [Nitrososphaeraceae archaeon]